MANLKNSKIFTSTPFAGSGANVTGLYYLPNVISIGRNPGVNDEGRLGQIVQNETNGTLWILAQLASKLVAGYQWIQISGGAGSFTTLTVSGLSSLNGGIQTNGAAIATTGGAITTGIGNIITTNGNISTTGTGNISSNTTLSAGTAITAGTGITTNTGNITATAGVVRAGADTGGFANTTTMAFAPLAPGAAPQTGLVGPNGGQVNSGYLKFYNGVTVAYVPYFTAP